VVEMALPLEASTGTSVNDFWSVSRKVPPGGYAFVVVIFAVLWELMEGQEFCLERSLLRSLG